MVLHDPDNSVQEKALALKFGRQKKVHVIDGQQVEVIPGDADSEEEEEEIGPNTTMEGPDGQYYVVLDVAHLDVQGGDVDQVVLRDQQILPDAAVTKTESSSIILPQLLSEGNIGDALLPQAQTDEVIRLKKLQERESCFGFDEDDEDD